MAGEADRVPGDRLERRVERGRVAVDAEAEERVRDHLGEVLVGEELAHEQQALDPRAGRGEDLEVRVPRVEPHAAPRPGRTGCPRGPGMTRGHRLQADALPVALVDEAPVAVAVAAQPLARCRDRAAACCASSQPSASTHCGRIPAIWPRPSRNGVVSASTSRPSTSRACCIVSTARCHAPGAAPVRWRTFRCEIWPLVPPSRTIVQELVDRVLELRVAVADVARVVAAVAADDLVQPDELVGRRRAARVELEAGREPERARVHRLGDVALHRRELLLGRLRREDAGGVAHRVVADEPREVLRVAGVREEREVLARTSPTRPARRRRTCACAPR